MTKVRGKREHEERRGPGVTSGLGGRGNRCRQCLSQDLETGCLKLAVVKFLGAQIFKGYHNILIFKP